jgi:hypothetical protein
MGKRIRLASRRANMSPNFAVHRLIIIKFSILVWFFLTSIRLYMRTRTAYVGTIAAKELQGFGMCLVMGNGPSLNKLNFNSIALLQNSRKLEVFAVNFYPLMAQFDELVPNYLVLSDPETSPWSISERNQALWRQIACHPQMKIITPSSWHFKEKMSNCEAKSCLHFNDTSLEGFSKNIDPLRPRGYPSLTAYKAIAFANYLQFSEIFYIGIDNTMFKDVSVNSDNQIAFPSNHAQSGYAPTYFNDNYYELGIGDVYYDLSEVFLGFRRSFKNLQLRNLDLDSLIDCSVKTEFIGETKVTKD